MQDHAPSPSPTYTYTPLHKAARIGRAGIIERLLEETPTSLNQKGRTEQYTPLHIAILHGHNRMAKCLLDQGADPNITDKRGWNALHHASFTGNIEMINRVLEKIAAAHVHAKTEKGETAIDIALAEGKDKVAWHLMNKINTPFLEIGVEIVKSISKTNQTLTKDQKRVALHLAQQLSCAYNNDINALQADINLSSTPTSSTTPSPSAGSLIATNQGIRNVIKQCLEPVEATFLTCYPKKKNYRVNLEKIPTLLTQSSIKEHFRTQEVSL